MPRKTLYESDLLFLRTYHSRHQAGFCNIVKFTNEACIDEHSLHVLYNYQIFNAYIDDDFTTLSICDPKLNATFYIDKILSQYSNA
jgi:hypothetical protein